MISITKCDDRGFNVIIGSSEYHFDTSNGYPVIFSKNSRLTIPNVDGWCLSQTQGKLSYRELQLMADSYKQGYTEGLKDRDIYSIEAQLCEHIIKEIFEKGHIDDLSELYWIECFKKSNFIAKFIPTFIQSFDKIRSQYGENNLLLLMNRIKVRLELLGQKDLLKLLSDKYRSLSIDPSEPVYPNVKDIAESIIKTHRIKELNDGPDGSFA